MELSVAIVDDIDTDRERVAADVRSALAAEGVACSLSAYASAEDLLENPPRGNSTSPSSTCAWRAAWTASSWRDA